MNTADRVRAALAAAKLPTLLVDIAVESGATLAVVETVARLEGFPVRTAHYQSIYTGRAAAVPVIHPKG